MFTQKLQQIFCCVYLEGFGNYTRIDYGTGHEAKFMAFLCCLMKIGAVPVEDGPAIVLKVTTKYVLISGWYRLQL